MTKFAIKRTWPNAVTWLDKHDRWAWNVEQARTWPTSKEAAAHLMTMRDNDPIHVRYADVWKVPADALVRQ